MSISDSGPGVGLRSESRSCVAALCGRARVGDGCDDIELLDGIGNEKPRAVPLKGARARDEAAE